MCSQHGAGRRPRSPAGGVPYPSERDRRSRELYTRVVHAGSASAALPRRLARTVSPVVFRRIALAAVGVLVLIVATGATVRLTGSGLGCPHWPTCTTQHALPRGYHSDIEFSNRVVSAVTVLTTLALALAAWRTSGLG